MSRYPLRTGRTARVVILPLIWTRPYAELDGDVLRVRFGWLGKAEVPVSAIAEAGTFRWPWWAGLGTRIGSAGLVAFVARSGTAALLELAGPVRVLMPAPWSARRLVIGVEDVEGFLSDLAAARLGLGPEEESAPA